MRNYKAQRDFMKSAICDDDLIATADIAHGVPQPSLTQKRAADFSARPLVHLSETGFLTDV